ncbi:MAG: aminotransferase class V-fold PLP-dependent enzyme [Bacteroidota bacterium]
MQPTKALELTGENYTQLMHAVVARVVDFIEHINTHPIDLTHEADPVFLRGMIEPAPETGTAFAGLLDFIFDKASKESLNPTSPGFLGYVPGGGLLHAGMADVISNALNRYVGVAAVAPAFVQMEANVIRWFCDIIGYPSTARGFLTSGGSMASLSALITARHVNLGEDFLGGVIYVSDQVHHCVNKAALLAGFPRANIRALPCDANYRLDPARVKATIDADRARGLTPFMLVGSAGTTNTGAVDPLQALHKLAKQEGLWFHVDGAYGGFFCMTARGRQKLAGIEKADSVVLDPHKTLFLPYGTGALLVHEGKHLKSTHSSVGDYMPPMQDDDAFVDFCELSPELTRPFRGLRVWLPIKMHGLATFRAYLDEKLDLAQWIESKINAMPALEVVAPAELSILGFTVTARGKSLDERNAQSRQVLTYINKKNRIHLTATTAKGVYIIRIAISVFRTHRDRMEMLVEDLEEALEVLGF